MARFVGPVGLATLLVAGSSTGWAGPKPAAPLFDNLGNLDHPVTTTSPEAQRYFNQGLTLCYALNHKEAIR